MTFIREDAPFPPCPTIGYFRSDYIRPSYDDYLRSAAEVVAQTVMNMPKGTTITVEKHKDGNAIDGRILTLTTRTELP